MVLKNILLKISVITIFIIQCLKAEQLNPSQCAENFSSGIDPNTCCRIPDILDDDLTEKCATNILKSQISRDLVDMNGSVGMSLSIRCITHCVYDESGIIKNGELQIETAYNRLSKLIDQNQKNWDIVLRDALQHCDALSVNYTTKNLSDKDNCTPLAAFLVGCLNTNLFVNCPASEWMPSEYIYSDKYLDRFCNLVYVYEQIKLLIDPGCDTLKDYADDCPVFAAITKID